MQREYVGMASGTAITIRYNNNIKEHMRASDLYYRTTSFAKGDKVLAVLLLLAGLYATVFYGFNWWTFFIVLAPIEWFNLLSPYRIRAYRSFKANPKYHEPCQLTFSREDIHFVTPSIDSHLQWSIFQRVLEDDQLFLLVSGKWSYSVIPKRAFASPAEVDAFRALVQEMIAGKGSL